VIGFVALSLASPAYDDNEEAEIDLPGIMIPSEDGSDADVNDDPKPCCLPTKWQGKVTAQSGFSPSGRRGEDEAEDRRHGGGGRRRGGFQQRTTAVFVDQRGTKIAGNSPTCNDTVNFIVLFGANSTADLYLYKSVAKKCFYKKANRAEFHQQCIPANATYGGTVSIGPKDKGLSVQIFNFHGGPHREQASDKPRRGVFVSGRALVTPECIPVVFQNHGFISNRPGPHPRPPRTTTKKSNGLKFQNNDEEFTDDDDSQSELDEELNSDRPGPRRGGGGGFMGSSYFTDIEPTITDEGVFVPPDYCKKALISGNTLEVGVDVAYPDLLDTFVSLE